MMLLMMQLLLALPDTNGSGHAEIVLATRTQWGIGLSPSR